MRRSARFLAMSLFVVTACTATLLTIPIEREAEVVIARGTVLEDLVGELGFGEFVSMDLANAQELENQGVAPGDVRDVELVLFELEATAPNGADLSFIDSMQLYAEAPGLPRVLVASASSFPAGQAVVAFDIEPLDLTDYVVSESMTLDTEVSGRRPDQDTTVVARFAVDVGVTGQGACAFASAGD